MCKLRAAFDRLSGFYCEKWEGGNFDEPKEKEKGKEPQQSKPHYSLLASVCFIVLGSQQQLSGFRDLSRWNPFPTARSGFGRIRLPRR